MSRRIKKDEALILLKGAIKMAQQDIPVTDEEADLIERIMTASNIQPFEIGEFDEPIQEDINELANKLKTRLAKRAFLLAMATVALADGSIGIGEKQWFTELANLLEVGTLKLEELTFDKAEAMVIKLLEDQESTEGKGLDMDLI